jgi:hypothetical protein
VATPRGTKQQLQHVSIDIPRIVGCNGVCGVVGLWLTPARNVQLYCQKVTIPESRNVTRLTGSFYYYYCHSTSTVVSLAGTTVPYILNCKSEHPSLVLVPVRSTSTSTSTTDVVLNR